MKIKIEMLQEIYNSEINFVLMSPCWDGGFTVIIGPEDPYGVNLSRDNCAYYSDGIQGIETAIDHLIEKVLEIYPDSQFSENMKGTKVS